MRYPFASRISPHEQRLLADPAALERFERSRIGTLAARTTPDVTPIGLDWVADWAVWLFAFDDTYCDAASMGLHPGRVVRRIVPLMRVLDDPREEPPSADRYACALADLRDRFADFADAEQWARFAAAGARVLRRHHLGGRPSRSRPEPHGRRLRADARAQRRDMVDPPHPPRAVRL